jgi:tripartite-type tricarboxylate transporter receptor subunit TctC
MASVFLRCTAAVAFALAVVWPNAARAEWPERPITLVHGWGVGGNADLIARIVAERLTARLGQSVIVEPKAGGAGRTAALLVTRAPADGYTLNMVPAGHAAAAAMHVKLPYHPVNDFTWIGMVTQFPVLIATNSESSIKTVPDLIAAAKAAPKPIIYGTPGTGSTQHLLVTLLAHTAKIELQHLPGKSGADISQMLLGKHIDFLADSPAVVLELAKAGKLHPIATTGATRYWALPDVPTIGETIPGFEGMSYFGLVGPPNMPADIVKRLNAETVAMAEDAQMVERFKALGSLPVATTPEGFKARVVADIERFTKLVKDAGIKRIGE